MADIKVIDLSLDASDNEWLSFLQLYNSQNENSSPDCCGDKKSICKSMDTITNKLDALLTNIVCHDSQDIGFISDHLTLATYGVNTIRILLRFRPELSQDMEILLMRIVLSFAVRSIQNNKEYSSLCVGCMRCCINLLFSNEARIKLFWDMEQSADFLVSILKSYISSSSNEEMIWNEALDVQYFVIRLVHMSIIQSPTVLSTVLPPASCKALQLVSAVAKCLHSIVTQREQSYHHSYRVRWEQANGRVYVEGSKLLFALSVWDVCQLHSSYREAIVRHAYVSALQVIIGTGNERDPTPIAEWGHSTADHALQLLMNAEVNEVLQVFGANAVDQHQTVTALVRQLNRQLDNVATIRRAGDQAAILTPILVVLTKLCAAISSFRDEFKPYVFPNPWRQVPILPSCSVSTDLEAKPAARNVTVSTNRNFGGEKVVESEDVADSADGAGKIAISSRSGRMIPAALMDPQDSESGSLRTRLLSFMTSLDSQLKRCAAELMFLLCEEDAEEFTVRTGFGNAVALLQLKGLV